MTEQLKNLDMLADQIYQEGIEKAKHDSKAIVQKAKEDSSELVRKAGKEANTIISGAEKKAEKLRSRVEGELSLEAKQFMSDLKKEIQEVIANKLVDQQVKAALVDVGFLQEIIREVVKKWKPEEELYLVLSEDMETKIDDAFKKSIKDILPNLTIQFSENINGGFRIGRASEHYRISFSESEFIQFFRSYLSKQVRDILQNGGS